VYSRTIDGQTLTLVPTGWTYKRTFVLYDRETGTLWFPEKDSLKGIQGKYFGRVLPGIDFKDTTWKKWKSAHPSSSFLR